MVGPFLISLESADATFESSTYSEEYGDAGVHFSDAFWVPCAFMSGCGYDVPDTGWNEGVDYRSGSMEGQ